MTSLVTGGAGFIGSNLVRALLDQGSSVIVLDDFSSGRPESLPASPRLTTIEARLQDVDDLPVILSGCDHVFHLAGQVGTMPSLLDPLLDADSNVTATVRLLLACRDAPIRKVVCSGSAAIFGEPRALPIGEDHPQDPASFYALSKLAAERYALLASALLAVPAVSLRYFNVYGQPMAQSEYAGVIRLFFDRLIAGEPLVIYGDGSQTRDFVYVRDVVAANLLAAGRATPGTAYNIGSGMPTTILELATLMSRLVGREPDFEFRPARPGEVQASVADISRAGADLGFAPAYGLERGLGEMWAGFSGTRPA